MCFEWRWPWKKRVTTSGLEHLQVRLYSRAACHLCEEAWEELERERKRYRFLLTVVDVDSDPALVARFGDCVPVVTVNDKVRFRGRVNRVLLARLLTAEARPTSRGSPVGHAASLDPSL